MLSAEGIGKNIEQAIENALFELKAAREDVDIKILSEGGLFKKAKVVVTISDDAVAKYEKKQTIKEEKKEEKTTVKEEKKLEKIVEKEEKETKKKEENTKTTEIEQETTEQNSEIEEQEVGMDPVEFLKGLFTAAGKEFEIKTSEDDKYITYSVVGDDMGDMIGHRGETFYAINRILAAVTGKQEKRILLDIGGYREKRVETLTALAKRMADRVAKSGRYARLDPMNPSDRRIIHSALSEDERVVTMSKGEEPRRYVMIFPKDE